MGRTLKFDRDDQKCLEVEVRGAKGKTKKCMLPLSGSLDLGDSMELMKAYNKPKKKRDHAFFLWFYDFCCRHLGKATVDAMSADQFRHLADVWQDESDKDGASLGE